MHRKTPQEKGQKVLKTQLGKIGQKVMTTQLKKNKKNEKVKDKEEKIEQEKESLHKD